jgi:hypothetical protein
MKCKDIMRTKLAISEIDGTFGGGFYVKELLESSEAIVCNV